MILETQFAGMKYVEYFFVILIGLSCQNSSKELSDESRDTIAHLVIDSMPAHDSQTDSTNSMGEIQKESLDIPKTTPQELVQFAKTLIGIPYKYASTDPSKGFDCSGFITYVFNHFTIDVPRSSVDFTNVGQEINRAFAKEGDLILFTGTVDSIKTVGHMGIVTQNSDTLKFIHSTSGRANGVTISKLDDHYKKRFVKVIRVFPE